MTAHQKQIRDAQMDDHPVPKDLSRAEVREITHAEAKSVILKYEWLGTMGMTRRAFGLFFDGELAGAECFGMTAGTGVSNLCGPEHADRVMTIVRGACVHWAHPHSASYLISRACKFLAAEGKNIFAAYSDVEADEIGTVYQACGWHYCGMTGDRGSIIVSPSGVARDERSISHFVRDRVRNTKGPLFFRKPSRAEIRAELLQTNHTFKPRTPKHRYVGIYGDETLTDSLRWGVLPYPKRSGVEKSTVSNRERVRQAFREDHSEYKNKSNEETYRAAQAAGYTL
jgi:hypothetical protein